MLPLLCQRECPGGGACSPYPHLLTGVSLGDEFGLVKVTSDSKVVTVCKTLSCGSLEVVR